MCFYVRNHYDKPRIAKEDIICYKFLKRDWSSPYYVYKWSINTLQYSSIRLLSADFTVDFVARIYEGFHSYSNKKIQYYDGTTETCPLYKFIIPKGSEYYYDPVDKQYVSNQIIFTGECVKYKTKSL